MKKLLKNCRIISPDVDIARGYVIVEKDTITAVGMGDAPQFDGEILDLDGKNLLPGFIDIHCHGRSGYDFCDQESEAFTVIGRDKLKDGVTSFLATTLTLPEEDLVQVCRNAVEYHKNVKDGANLLGLHLEGPFFNPPCAGAQNPAYLKPLDIGLIDRLNTIFPVKKVSFSPELPGSPQFTAELTQRQIMASGGHTQATEEEFEACRLAGMKHLTHFCNVMTPLHHLRFGLVGAGLLNDDVALEMICDGIHLGEKMLRLIAKNKPAEKMMIITDAMRASGMPDGDYSLGGLPVLVKNGKATLSDGVTVAGSTLRYYEGLKHLVKVTGLPLAQAVKAAGSNQARTLDLGKRGEIRVGYLADIAVLDENFTPSMTICGGEIRWSVAG